MFLRIVCLAICTVSSSVYAMKRSLPEAKENSSVQSLLNDSSSSSASKASQRELLADKSKGLVAYPLKEIMRVRRDIVVSRGLENETVIPDVPNDLNLFNEQSFSELKQEVAGFIASQACVLCPGKEISRMTFSYDNALFASIDEDCRTIRIIDFVTSAVRTTIICPEQVNSVSFNHNGSQIVAASALRGKVIIFNVETGAYIKELQCADYPVNSAVFNHAGTQIAVLSTKRKIIIIDFPSGDIIGGFPVFSDMNPLFTADGTKLLFFGEGANSNDFDAFVVSGLSLGLYYYYYDHLDDVIASAFSPDASRLVVVTKNGKIKIVDSNTEKEIKIFSYSWDAVKISFNSDGSKLIVADNEKIRIVDSQKGTILHTVENTDWSLAKTVLSSDGSKLAVPSHNQNVIRVFDLAQAKKTADRLTLNEVILLKAFEVAKNDIARIHANPEQWEIWRSLQAKLPEEAKSKLTRFIVCGGAAQEDDE